MTYSQALDNLRSRLSYPGLAAQPRIVLPEGNGSYGLAIVGEAAGEHESQDCLPFRPYAQAGSVLHRALMETGVARERTLITNCVWWQPAGNRLAGTGFETYAIEACREVNQALLQELGIKAVLALGAIAMKEFSWTADPRLQGSGKKHRIDQVRGHVAWPGNGALYGLPVIASYHPSSLRRGSQEKGEFGIRDQSSQGKGMGYLGILKADLKAAMRLAKGGFAKPPDWGRQVKLDANEGDWWELIRLIRSGDRCFYYDFETTVSIHEDEEDLRAALEGKDEEEEEKSPEDTREILDRAAIQEGMRFDQRPTQFQVSVPGGPVLVTRWRSWMRNIVLELMALKNPRAGFNSRFFDQMILRGLEVPGVGDLRYRDLMDRWHHWQPDWPRGLQCAASFSTPEWGAWKHLSESYGKDDDLAYGVHDVHRLERLDQDLDRWLPTIVHPISGKDLQWGYETQVHQLGPVLDRMTGEGIPISEARRVEVRAGLTEQEHASEWKLQELHPRELRNLSPKEGYRGCAGLPEELVIEKEEIRVGKSGKPLKAKVVREPVEGEEGEVRVLGMWPDAGWLPREYVCRKFGENLRWAQVIPFTPSSQQMIKYLEFKVREEGKLGKGKWKIPEHKDTGRPTSGKKDIESLWRKTQDPLLKETLEFRGIQKLRTTYCGKDGAKPGEGWVPIKGRVHSKFGFKPATGQLNSFDPNAQNFPSRGLRAKLLMSLMEADPGKRIVVLDYKSFHALTLGFEAGDLDYMRLARLDIHSFFEATALLKIARRDELLRLSDEDLMKELKRFKADEREIFPGPTGKVNFKWLRENNAKPTILGVGFGMQALRLHKENETTITSKSMAETILRAYYEENPLIAKYQKAVQDEADLNRYLATRYGYVRRFHHVFDKRPVSRSYAPRWNEKLWARPDDGSNWVISPGDDAEAAVALRPANDAFGYMRSAMVEIGDRGLDWKFGLFNNVHDALWFHCKGGEVDRLLSEVIPLMERKDPVLKDPVTAPDGLWCKTSVKLTKVGGNMGEMEEL